MLKLRRYYSISSGPMMLARNSLIKMAAGSTITLVTTFPLYSDGYTHLSFGGLLLDNLMDPLVAFAIYGTATRKNNFCTNIVYDTVNVDTHSSWNLSTNEYIVPLNGVYVISTTVISLFDPYDYIKIMINDTHFAKTYYGDLPTSGVDSFCATITVNVQKYDRLSTRHCNDNNSKSSPDRYDVSMIGFLISPKKIQPVNFMAFRTSGANGLLDPIDYDDVVINIGNGWNKISSKFTAPYDGVYYVYMSYLTTLWYNKPTKIELLLNGLPVTSAISYNSAGFTSGDQRMYDFIFRLVKNDELRFRQPSGFGFHANGTTNMYVSIFRVHI